MEKIIQTYISAGQKVEDMLNHYEKQGITREMIRGLSEDKKQELMFNYEKILEATA